MKYDYDNSGIERDIVASPHTLMVYEQEFKAGMIEQVFGRVDLVGNPDDVDEEGRIKVADYTRDHWLAYVKALWAMLKAGADLARVEGREYTPVPSFEEWSIKAAGIDMAEVSHVVVTECQRGLFRAGAAPDGEAADEAEEA